MNHVRPIKYMLRAFYEAAAFDVLGSEAVERMAPSAAYPWKSGPEPFKADVSKNELLLLNQSLTREYVRQRQVT
jgi:hypothetical protein